ncbi:MAG: 16S rRNA (cytidine(1402)-2'-O)-methyltransferase [Dehalococcoidia bacterium]|nr:16S rRNA (cytidine(1402)-2'-O)-methyltransferase [Dehalococcoidia bacterium]
MPALYVVATPIGNLEDITLRAIRTLREVKLIAAEDTRHTRRLLNAYEIKTPVTSYHQHNKLTKLDYILGRLQNDDVALVSDAGTPGISDPGYELIVTANQRSISVIPVPGPSVIITALVASGLPTSSFTYLGFLPRRAGERSRLLKSVATERRTMVLFESPHRLMASLSDIQSILGDRRIAVCRELTKLYEEVFHGTVSQAIKHFAAPKGEFTLVIEGAKEEGKAEMTGDVQQELRRLRKQGITAREAVARVAGETGLSKKELYRAWIKAK